MSGSEDGPGGVERGGGGLLVNHVRRGEGERARAEDGRRLQFLLPAMHTADEHSSAIRQCCVKHRGRRERGA